MADIEDDRSEISVPISTTHRTSKPSRSILKRGRQATGRFVRAVSKPVAFRLPKRERPDQLPAAPGEPDVVAVRRSNSRGSGGSGGFLRAFLFGAPRMRRERTDDYQEDEEGAEYDPAERIPDPLAMPNMPTPVVMPHPGGGISFVQPDNIPVNPPPLALDPTPPQEGEYRRDYLRHNRQGTEDMSEAHTGYGAPALGGYPAGDAGGGQGLAGTMFMPEPEPTLSPLSPVRVASPGGDEFRSPRYRHLGREQEYTDYASPRSRASGRSYARREQDNREYESPRSRASGRSYATRRDVEGDLDQQERSPSGTRPREGAGMPPTPPQPVRRVVPPDIPSPPISPLSAQSPRSAKSRRSSRSHVSRMPPPAPPITLASPVSQDPVLVMQGDPDYSDQPQAFEYPNQAPPHDYSTQPQSHSPMATDYAYQPAPQTLMTPTPAAPSSSYPVEEAATFPEAGPSTALIPEVHIQPPSDEPSGLNSLQPSRAPSRPISHISRLSRRTRRSKAPSPPTADGEAGPSHSQPPDRRSRFSVNTLPLRWDRIPHAARPLSYFFPRDRDRAIPEGGHDPSDRDGAAYQHYFISRLPPSASTTEKIAHLLDNVSRYPWIQKPWQTVQYVPGDKGGLGARYEIPETEARGDGWAPWYTRPGEPSGEGKRASSARIGESFYTPRGMNQRVGETSWQTPQPQQEQQWPPEQQQAYAPSREASYRPTSAERALSRSAVSPGPSSYAYSTQPQPQSSQANLRPISVARSPAPSRARSRPNTQLTQLTIPPTPPPKTPRAYRPRGLSPTSAQAHQATVIFRDDGTPELIIPEGADLPTSPILITDPQGRTGWFMPQVALARSLESPEGV